MVHVFSSFGSAHENKNESKGKELPILEDYPKILLTLPHSKVNHFLKFNENSSTIFAREILLTNRKLTFYLIHGHRYKPVRLKTGQLSRGRHKRMLR